MNPWLSLAASSRSSSITLELVVATGEADELATTILWDLGDDNDVTKELLEDGSNGDWDNLQPPSGGSGSGSNPGLSILEKIKKKIYILNLFFRREHV